MAHTEYLYGIHTVQAVLQHHPERIVALYLQHDRQDQRVQTLAEVAEQVGVKVQWVAANKLTQWVGDAASQGVVAQCRSLGAYSEDHLNALLENLPTSALFLVLDGVQDPHNLGACLRTADAVGVHAVIAPKDRSVGLTPVVRKVACGAAETTPFIQVTNLARMLNKLKEARIWVYGLADSAPASLYATDLRGALALVLGAEGQGLRRLTQETCDDLLAIPMSGSVESLNVSVATGVCLYEAWRQRNL